MSYKFKKIDFSYGTMPRDKIRYDYGVDYDSLDDEIKALFQIAWHGWTQNEIQMIINKSKLLKNDQEFEYQVEGSDLLISIDIKEVHFFDWHTDKVEADFIWTFNEFIDFMEKFKKFLKENS